MRMCAVYVSLPQSLPLVTYLNTRGSSDEQYSSRGTSTVKLGMVKFKRGRMTDLTVCEKELFEVGGGGGGFVY